MPKWVTPLSLARTNPPRVWHFLAQGGYFSPRRGLREGIFSPEGGLLCSVLAREGIFSPLVCMCAPPLEGWWEGGGGWAVCGCLSCHHHARTRIQQESHVGVYAHMCVVHVHGPRGPWGMCVRESVWRTSLRYMPAACVLARGCCVTCGCSRVTHYLPLSHTCTHVHTCVTHASRIPEGCIEMHA